MQNLVGQTVLHQYEIEEQIGSGGQAEIYRAYDRQRGIPVVLKLLRRNHAMRQDYRQALRDEVLHLEKLSHPHIVQYFGSGEEGNSIFLVMRYIEGDSLRNHLKRNPLYFSPENTIRILSEIAKAVDYIHSQRMLHRDIKPANIMIDKNGEAVLIDLGIATNVQNTNSSAPVGTPAYMSPEQCAGQPLNPRTDIYSLGLVAYELLTRKRLFDGDTKSTFHAQQHIPFDKIGQLPAEYQAAYPVFAKVLAKLPGERFHSARVFVDELNKVLGMPYDVNVFIHRPASRPSTGRDTSPPVNQTASLPPQNKSRAIPIIMILAILAVVVGTAAIFSNVFGNNLPEIGVTPIMNISIADITPATSTRVPSNTPVETLESGQSASMVTSTRNIPTATSTFTPTRTATVPTPTRTLTRTKTPTPFITVGRVNITTAVLRVRNLPDIDSTQIAALENQDQVTITGRDASNQWLRVQLDDGQVGWVTAQYITVSNINRLPVIRR